MPLDPDPVAEVQQLEDLEIEGGQGVLRNVDLDLRQTVRKDEEIGVAKRADGQNAAACRGVNPFGFQLLAAPSRVCLHESRHAGASLERVWIGVHAELRQFAEVVTPL